MIVYQTFENIVLSQIAPFQFLISFILLAGFFWVMLWIIIWLFKHLTKI